MFALAVNPKDGSVWGTTEAGLFRYVNSRWTYFTRAEGLPSDQANALAFDADGTLYVGTQCDGIAVASPADGYHSWRVVPGPASVPNAPSGTGLPSALINCLLATKSGTVYAGTNCGLVSSQDKGRTWHYRRGVDWKAKEAGLYPPVTPVSVTVSGDLLSEDYVTALAEGADGSIFVGHRQTSVEAFSPKTGLRVQSGLNGAKTDSYISGLLLAGQSAWVGLYGGGVLPPNIPPGTVPSASSLAAAPLPVPAKPPTLVELKTMLARVQSFKDDMPVGGGAYLGEDWQTQGDWVGRYGRQYAILCAADAPLDHDIISDVGYRVTGSIGPHCESSDSIRRWVTQAQTDQHRSLYDPIPGFRRQAEWDDHAEAYSETFEGPDIWAAITVPAGLHKFSLYDVNKDAHDSGSNRDRDYLVDLLPFRAKVEDAELLPPIAHARICNFWDGMYQSFLVHGPARYYVHIRRNSSFNTLLAGVFLDSMTGPKTRFDCSAWMGGIHYSPPNPDAPTPPDPHLLDKLLAGNGKLASSIGGTSPTFQDQKIIPAARVLWDALDAVQDNPAALSFQLLGRRMAYRAAVAAGASDALQADWRWTLHLWNASDRQEFTDTMHQAHESLLTLYPDMRNHSY